MCPFNTKKPIARARRVGEPFKPKGGRPVPIYGLLNIDPELCTEAQRRYEDQRDNPVSSKIVPEIVTEIVDMVKNRKQVDSRTLENVIRQPSMKIALVQRVEYLDKVINELIGVGVEVY
jgi:hypothetical protein